MSTKPHKPQISQQGIKKKPQGVTQKAEQTIFEAGNPSSTESRNDYAIDRLSNGEKTIVDSAGVSAKKLVRQKQARAERGEQNQLAAEPTEQYERKVLPPVQKEFSETSINGQVPYVNQSEPVINLQTQQSPAQAAKSNPVTPRKKAYSPPKTKPQQPIRKAHQDKTIRTASNESSARRKTKDIERVGNTVKKADTSAKTFQKTASGAKKTKSTAKAASETTKKTKAAARATAKMSVKAARLTARAVAVTGKAIAGGAKGIGAAIATGGAPAVVIIIVVCLVGAIGGTCFGIFLSNDESTGSQMTMTQAISKLTAEHYDSVTAFQNSYNSDSVEIVGSTAINWRDTLAVYAIKTTSGDNPLEVVTLDDEKLNLLRDVLKDMNPITGVVTPKVVPETKVFTDAVGNQTVTTDYVTKRVLTVTIVQLNGEQISALYRFDHEQRKQLAELLSSDYDSLWNELIGSGGQIIQSGSSHVGVGMFSWPFEQDQRISSDFGMRVNPVTGIYKLHGGVDIAAPLGTPILAAADGTVVTATWHNSYGYYVKIKHDDTYSTLYAHCSSLNVSPGQAVRRGQVISRCGSTGASTGSHCHFEVVQNGVRVNPMGFFA